MALRRRGAPARAARAAPLAAAGADWYAGYRVGDDGGYLAALIARCRALLATLPSRALVAGGVRRALARASESQSRNHAALLGGCEPAALARWAAEQPAAAAHGLRWWEVAAAGGSSLALHALLAAAADPRLTPAGAARLEAAYWPWACALNTLLESVADEAADAASGNHCYARHYGSPQAAGARIAAIAAHASAALRTLPDARHHESVLSAMACFYLAGPRAGWTPAVREAVLPRLALDPRPVERALALMRRLG